MAREVLILAGLGNPGAEYEHTRHNAGFDTMSLIEKHYGNLKWKKMLQGQVAEIPEGDGRKIVLVKPMTYMNLSGECIAAVMKWYHCPAANVTVIYDDIDLPLGRIRVRASGSAGTHNGMRSIVNCMGTQEFPRIRVGVGAKPEGWDLANWVLSRYQSAEDRKTMEEAFARAADAAVDLVNNGIEHCMQYYNRT